LITNEINTTGKEMRIFADDLVKKADCFEESIPVYFAAASLYKKEGYLSGMGSCVGGALWEEGMHVANMGMIKRDVTMKEVVKRHVIPLMHDVKNQILEVTSVSEKDKCEKMSWVLYCIARSEALVYDGEAAAQAMKESDVWEERKKPWWKRKRR